MSPSEIVIDAGVVCFLAANGLLVLGTLAATARRLRDPTPDQVDCHFVEPGVPFAVTFEVPAGPHRLDLAVTRHSGGFRQKRPASSDVGAWGELEVDGRPHAFRFGRAPRDAPGRQLHTASTQGLGDVQLVRFPLVTPAERHARKLVVRGTIGAEATTGLADVRLMLVRPGWFG